MKIVIETIPHASQRYPTLGDWYFVHRNPDGTESNLTPGESPWPLNEQSEVTLYIKVSKLSDWNHAALIAVHELVEVLLCVNDGVTQEQVDKFDMEYERTRKPGDESEPGDAVLAPYRDQHCYATAVERMLCAAFGLSWQEYESEIGSLYEAEVASGQNESAPVQPVVPEMGGCPQPPVST